MANQHARSPGDARQAREAPGRPPLSEWLVATFGLLLVAGSIGYLAWAAIGEQPGEADPVVELVSVQPRDRWFEARVRVNNRGRGTAETLKITGRLLRGEQEVARAELVFDYLPGASTREGVLFFPEDPRQLRLELAPESYLVP